MAHHPTHNRTHGHEQTKLTSSRGVLELGEETPRARVDLQKVPAILEGLVAVAAPGTTIPLVGGTQAVVVLAAIVVVVDGDFGRNGEVGRIDRLEIIDVGLHIIGVRGQRDLADRKRRSKERTHCHETEDSQ